MELLRLHEAAKLLSISYPTLKQWIYKEKIRSIKTPGGHHRIPGQEVERLIGVTPPRSSRDAQAGLHAISGRNKLLGTITEVRSDGLLAQVTMNVGGQSITSIITRSACEELDLRPGAPAFALIKATEVMVIRG
ncbi:MAG: helix-turn-helix transcriptional regulator [Acidobacteria bacterium]|nr:helix-turn-helix transcriptional regulator [Acidobacteriota bacterium]